MFASVALMAWATGAALEDPDDLGALGRLRQRTGPLALARDQVLPVLPAFESLLPEPGLRRGTVTRVHGPGATSLALALLAGCTAAGSWVAAIGVRGLGAGGGGRARPRARAPAPGRRTGRRVGREGVVRLWSTAVAAAVDGLDAVLVEVPRRVPGGRRPAPPGPGAGPRHRDGRGRSGWRLPARPGDGRDHPVLGGPRRGMGPPAGPMPTGRGHRPAGGRAPPHRPALASRTRR